MQLCEVLLCCLTALGGVLLSESRRSKATQVAPPGPGYAEVANEVAKRLNLLQEEVGVPGLGWVGLDAAMVFRIILFAGQDMSRFRDGQSILIHLNPIGSMYGIYGNMM